jgi:CRP-like cAMP-binding protein
VAVELDILGKIPYFSGLSTDDLTAIKKFVVDRKAERSEIILLEGDPAKAIYFIISGAVKIYKTSAEGKEQITAIMRAGDAFNYTPVFSDDGTNNVSAQAMSPVHLYEIAKNDMLYLVSRYSKIAINVTRGLAGGVRTLLNLVEDLSFRHVISRVAKILLEYALDQKKGPAPRLTQQDMAAMAGTAREIVGRSLRTLEDKGMIRLDQRRIVIRNKKALHEIAGTSFVTNVADS